MPCLSSDKEFQVLSSRMSYLKNAVKTVFLLPMQNCLQLKSLGRTKCLNIVWIMFWILIPNVHLNLCLFERPLMSCHLGHKHALKWSDMLVTYMVKQDPSPVFLKQMKTRPSKHWEQTEGIFLINWPGKEAYCCKHALVHAFSVASP